MIAYTGALLNHGKSSNGRKSSRPSTKSQKPCCEMFVTSASEVAGPGISDLLFAFLDQLLRPPQALIAQPVGSSELDPWLTQNFASPSADWTWMCRRSSSPEKKKNPNGPARKTVGLIPKV